MLQNITESGQLLNSSRDYRKQRKLRRDKRKQAETSTTPTTSRTPSPNDSSLESDSLEDQLKTGTMRMKAAVKQTRVKSKERKRHNGKDDNRQLGNIEICITFSTGLPSWR